MAKAIIIEKTPRIKILRGGRIVKINQRLPFRVRFTNIMVPNYSSTNVPPIGIAVIGISNYIL
jgi:hypothetical protein